MDWGMKIFLHPDPDGMYTRMETICTSGCGNRLHPGVRLFSFAYRPLSNAVCRVKTWNWIRFAWQSLNPETDLPNSTYR